MKSGSRKAFFAITLVVSGTLIFLLLALGKKLELPSLAIAQAPGISSPRGSSLGNPFALLIAQVAIIVLLARICGWLMKKIGQPAVMGEIAAGILLGPSVLGGLLPGMSHVIFPATSIGILEMFSQFGLVLFMFVIGMELRPDDLRKHGASALVISYAGMLTPFTLGVCLAYFLYPLYAPNHSAFFSFALFVGIALSITAFPVLSRIIRERGVSATRVGTLAISAAAIGDLSAWCLLSIVVALVRSGSALSASYSLIRVAVYALLMMVIAKPILAGIHRRLPAEKHAGPLETSLIFGCLLLSAFTTEFIGIHALFGAFAMGLIMPKEEAFRMKMIQKIEDIALVLLLPIFFALTGLRTQVNFLGQASLWGPFLMIVVVAVAGKLGATFLAARFSGESIHDSISLGLLMNTRGLVELVVLNIGYDLGILGPPIFTMMVLMALLTTFMTNPLMNLLEKMNKGRLSAVAERPL